MEEPKTLVQNREMGERNIKLNLHLQSNLCPEDYDSNPKKDFQIVRGKDERKLQCYNQVRKQQVRQLSKIGKRKHLHADPYY